MPESVKIDDLLNRRSDLSTFVVHLTKDGEASARENLARILTTRTIEARKPMGWMGTRRERLKDRAHLDAMKVVCFSETPLEHVYSLFQDIPNRQTHLAPYGLAFSKHVVREKGANPVWYVNMEAGFTWEIAPALDSLREAAKANPAGFEAHPASKILPFIEQTGSWTSTRKDFSWEREWRHRGNFVFRDLDVALVVCPEPEIDEFEEYGPYAAVDPSWSLERIVERLVLTRATYVSMEQRRIRRANIAS